MYRMHVCYNMIILWLISHRIIGRLQMKTKLIITYNRLYICMQIALQVWNNFECMWPACVPFITVTSHERHGVSNHRQLDHLVDQLFWLAPRKILNLDNIFPLWGKSTGDQWMLFTKECRKCVHGMTSLCYILGSDNPGIQSPNVS